MRVNLVEHCLFRHAENPSRRNRKALVFARHDGADEEWTYARMAEAVRGFAGGLSATGASVGERVLIHLDNSSEYAVAFFGACAAGLVPIPASPQLTREEVEFLLEDSGASLLIVEPDMAEGLRPKTGRGALRHVVVNGDIRMVKIGGVEKHDFHTMLHTGDGDELPTVGDEDPAYLIYTSGTTARPKGVLHAHRSVNGRRIVIQEWEGLREDDRVCHAGALNWTYTIGVGLMDPWAVGATAILYAGPRRPQVWLPLLERTEATVFAAVPTVFRQILKYVDVEDYRLPGLRHVLTAGEALMPETYREWKRRMGVEMYEALGMSEISTYISFKPGMTVKPGACGVPQAGRDVRLLALDSTEPVARGESGRIAVSRSDPGLMLDYWNRPEEREAVFEGEWFIGGDTAREDEDGVWWFDGRNDDVMSSFGYRVSPQEVESVLSTHPDVAECAVAMMPTGESGVELITAFIKLKDGITLDEESLETHCREHLAEYKCPKAYRLIHEIPRTANGKIARRELRA